MRLDTRWTITFRTNRLRTKGAITPFTPTFTTTHVCRYMLENSAGYDSEHEIAVLLCSPHQVAGAENLWSVATSIFSMAATE